MHDKHEDLEVEIRPGENRAIIAGKTAVSFKKIVALILQRKVTTMLKEWGDDPVIVSSELLTGLASAPQDSQENRAQVITVTLGTGVLLGIFFFALTQATLLALHIELDMRALLIIVAGLLGLALLVAILAKLRNRGQNEKIVDTMDKLASLLSRK
ncbi:MAG: hypothetical protein WCX29_03800 [Candidatus Peribacteraceae bacterium]|nr:hypothetical protein [Candidatus Peribacteria bacterium]